MARCLPSLAAGVLRDLLGRSISVPRVQEVTWIWFGWLGVQYSVEARRGHTARFNDDDALINSWARGAVRGVGLNAHGWPESAVVTRGDAPPPATTHLAGRAIAARRSMAMSHVAW